MQFRVGLIWTVVYFVQKYGIAALAVLVSEKYGIGPCCLFLTITHLVASYVQLRAYDRAQNILHTTAWIQRIKNGEFAYEGVRFRAKLFRRAISRLDSKMVSIILLMGLQFQVKMLLWAIFNFHGRAMFIILSTQFDSFVATAYIRDTGGLKWSSTVIFIVAFVIGLVYSTAIYTGIGLLIFG